MRTELEEAKIIRNKVILDAKYKIETRPRDSSAGISPVIKKALTNFTGARFAQLLRLRLDLTHRPRWSNTTSDMQAMVGTT